EPSIKTFIIGVFADANIQMGAQAKLDTIAAAGGTTSAHLIQTSGNVTQSFVTALDAVRSTKLACAYEVPAASAGSALDFGKVNVESMPPGVSSPATIGYVTRKEGCDATKGGWYYDVDPSTGTPTEIIMCPATCTSFGAGAGGQVDIRV